MAGEDEEVGGGPVGGSTGCCPVLSEKRGSDLSE